MNKKIQNIAWIDQNVDNPENRGYLNMLESSYPNFTIKSFKNIDDLVKNISECRFQVWILIVSGRLSENLLNNFEDICVKNSVAIAVIIFCRIISKYAYLSSNKYLAGGIVNSFTDVLDFINRNDISLNSIIIKYNNSVYNNPMAPSFLDDLYFNKYSDASHLNRLKLVAKHSRLDHNLLLYNFYKVYGENSGDYSRLFMEALNITCEKVFYVFPSVRGVALLRSYTNENSSNTALNLYQYLNQTLRKSSLQEMFNYNEYIYYTFALAKSRSINYCTRTLYRGSCLSENEKTSLKIGDVIYTRSFFSTSVNENVAINRMNKVNGKILYEIKPPSYIDQIFNNYGYTNLDLSQYSYFACEEEVLYLPLTVFKIDNIMKYNNGVTKIYMSEDLKKTIFLQKQVFESFPNKN